MEIALSLTLNCYGEIVLTKVTTGTEEMQQWRLIIVWSEGKLAGWRGNV